MPSENQSFDSQTRGGNACREPACREARASLLADLALNRINLREFAELEKILFGDPGAPVPQGLMVARPGKNIK